MFGTSRKFRILFERLSHMSQSLDALTQEVADVKTVAASALALINGFQARLDAALTAAAAGDDSAALIALTADLKTSADALAAAVTAGTPGAPTPAPSSPDPAPSSVNG